MCFISILVWWRILLLASLCQCHAAFVMGAGYNAGLGGKNDDLHRRVIPKEMGGTGVLECKWFNDDCYKKTENDCTKDPDSRKCRLVNRSCSMILRNVPKWIDMFNLVLDVTVTILRNLYSCIASNIAGSSDVRVPVYT